MNEIEEIERVLAEEKRGERRLLYFAALLAKKCDLRKEPFIIVGGSAIEIYTKGKYVSGDVDVVTTAKDRVCATLLEWGFSRQGRLWIRSDLGMAIDIVSDKYTGTMTLTREISTPYGNVRVAAVEDLLVKRLASTKHWKLPNDLGQALLLLRDYRESMDMSYLRKVAQEYDVVDLLDKILSIDRPSHVSRNDEEPNRTRD
jgi:hypothetical protein